MIITTDTCTDKEFFEPIEYVSLLIFAIYQPQSKELIDLSLPVS